MKKSIGFLFCCMVFIVFTGCDSGSDNENSSSIGSCSDGEAECMSSSRIKACIYGDWEYADCEDVCQEKHGDSATGVCADSSGNASCLCATGGGDVECTEGYVECGSASVLMACIDGELETETCDNICKQQLGDDYTGECTYLSSKGHDGCDCEKGVCQPNCSGRECGDDGCGGVCGECEKGWLCEDVDGLCYDPCDGKNCGKLEGVSCGECETGWLCGEDENLCYDPCGGKECGESEGVSCGSCEGEDLCQDNNCVNPCDSISCGTNEVCEPISPTEYNCRCKPGYFDEGIGCILHYEETNIAGEVTVTDISTGLIWTKIYRKNINRSDAINYCKSLAYGGIYSWMIPKSQYAMTLFDEDIVNSAPYSDFPDMPSERFWNIDESSNGDRGSCFNFSNDYFYQEFVNKDSENNARCLSRYYEEDILGHVIVIDYSDIGASYGKLGVWTKVSVQKNYRDAKDYCANLNYAGYQDWALPGVPNLSYLLDDAYTVPPYSDLPGLDAEIFWGDNPSWGYNFKITEYEWGLDQNEIHYVKCVRYGL